MLKLTLKAIAIVIVALAGISYLAYLRSGNYWLPSVTNPSWPILSRDHESAVETPRISQPAYKWLVNGRWVYGDKPPAGVDARAIQEEPGK